MVVNSLLYISLKQPITVPYTLGRNDGEGGGATKTN